MTRYHDNENDNAVVSGLNVFEDLGIELTEEDILKLGIARAITNVLVERELTQREAADIIGIDQPKISKVVRGQLKGLSVERMLNWLLILGCDFEVQVKKAREEEKGRVIFNQEAAYC